MWYQAPASGGGGPVGSPNLQSFTTNAATTGTSFNLTVNPSGANILMIFRADWFPSTSTANTPTWNGSSAGVLLLTNSLWDSSAIGDMRAWALVAPTTGSHTANFTFNTAIQELTYSVYVFTNAAQIANVYSGLVSSNSTSGVTTFTVNTPSTVGDYVLGMITVANSAETITPTGSLTNFMSTAPGTSMHQAAASGTNATVASTKMAWSWSGGFRVGTIDISIK